MGPSRTTRTSGIVVACTVAVALASCTADPSPTPSPSGSSDTSVPSPSASSVSPSPSASSASPTGTASAPAGFSLDDVTSPTFPDLGGDIGAIGAVRVGRHTGYDRVVWEFPRSGRPTYQVRYVTTPTADGSGDVVSVAGDAWLEVMVSTVGIPAASAPRPGKASASSIAGTVVAEARPVYGGFEGYGQSFVGVHDERRPFKVTVLRNPTRLVLDIYSG